MDNRNRGIETERETGREMGERIKDSEIKGEGRTEG